jgi:hypothetical protein
VRLRSLLATGLLALAASAPRVGTGALAVDGAADADLAAGVAAVQTGDFQAAVGFLSRAVRALGADAEAREADLVKAHLHLGAAFAGLGQDSPARSQFAQALLRRPEARLEVKGAPERARPLFEEARQEAAPVIAAGELQGKKSKKKTSLLLGGVAVAGAGVGIATVAGGASPSSTSPPPSAEDLMPASRFAFGSLSGNPYLSFVNGNPPSGTTFAVGTAIPRLVFRAQISSFVAPVGPFERLQAVVDLLTLDRGPCWRAESREFALAAGPPVELVIDSFPAQPSCVPPFVSLTVEAKLFDRAAGRQIGTSVYTGGYKVVP